MRHANSRNRELGSKPGIQLLAGAGRTLFGWGGRWASSAVALSLLTLLGVLLPAPSAGAVANAAAVASESPDATRAAMLQLRLGGNAVDAAVTAALMAGVTNPTSSGIGGGGFALVWTAATQKAFILDFRETAPLAVDAAAFEQRPLPPERQGVLVGVPGEVRGLYELHRRFGKRTWAEVVKPAQDAATRGFQVGRHVADSLASSAQKLMSDPGIASVFFPGGKPALFGRRVVNQKLGNTLALIAQQGPAAFYEGPVAKDLVEATRAQGGALTLAELKAYQPIERTPLSFEWEGKKIFTMPLPSAGGMMLAQTLSMFGSEELKKFGYRSGAYQHMLAEAMRAAVADRMRYLGDPAFEKVKLDKLMAPKRLAARRRSMSLERTHGIPRFGLEEHGTHHLTTLDKDGNMVALTTTVNRLFGAKFTAPETGVVLNDQLDDFTSSASVAPFGMKESPNRPRPGARPISSMTPTIVVYRGQAILGIGGSGGTTIPTNVTQLLLANLVFGRTPEQAVSDPRFYIPTERAYILLEKGASADLRNDLEWRGEIVGDMSWNGSAVQMIAVQDGRVLAGADKRKHGLAVAY